MQIIFSNQPLPNKVKKSIFLAGPSPRAEQKDTWRSKALRILENAGYDGVVFIPMPDFIFNNQGQHIIHGYEDQIDWEVNARKMSDVIVFWIDRKLDKNYLGLTTNFEFGEDLINKKFVYGRPEDSDKCKYIDNRVIASGSMFHKNILSTIEGALIKIGNGALRIGGETKIPIDIWNTQQFKEWYGDLVQAGNRIDDADVLYKYVTHGNVFSYVLKVKIWVESEKRHKGNEFIISRRSTSSIFAYYEDNIILVKEFRSPVSNEDGFVYELAGGSSFDDKIDPRENARTEFFEEVGVMIKDKERFKYVDARQMAATVLTHKSYLYKVELNEKEFKEVMKHKVKKEKIKDIRDNDEHTYIEVVNFSDIKKLPVDYSTLGMIFSAFHS